jgi:hypothetical protein
MGKAMWSGMASQFDAWMGADVGWRSFRCRRGESRWRIFSRKEVVGWSRTLRVLWEARGGKSGRKRRERKAGWPTARQIFT